MISVFVLSEGVISFLMRLDSQEKSLVLIEGVSRELMVA
jgi:hypothetical protein